MSLASTKTKAKTVLIIEDDAAISEVLGFNLTRNGYEALTASDGRQGLELARSRLPDLVILDLMLPTIDGIEICRTLRSEPGTRNLVILMLTAKSEEVDQIVGFKVGADDYVTKPFSIKVLMEKVRAVLNRQRNGSENGDWLQLHGIVLDRVAHEVKCDNEPVLLTPTEFRLLETLMRQPGRAYSRNDLLSSAVGEYTVVLERTIDVHIRSLRQKLGERAGLIETVRGVGYRFARNAK